MIRAGLAVTMLVTGSINTLSKRAQNQACAQGLDPDASSSKCSAGLTKFNAPWFQTLISEQENHELFVRPCDT